MSFYDGRRRESCAHFYPQETFPILPNRPFDEIPKADTIQLGRGLERGHRSELAVMALLSRPEVNSWVINPRYVGKDQQYDSAGIDVLFDLRPDLPEGGIISRITDLSSCRVQVKSSDNKVEQFIRERIRGDKNGTRGLYVLNGTHPSEFMFTDLAVQMLIHSGKIFERQTVGNFYAALDPKILSCVTCPHILGPIVQSRSLLVKRFYPEVVQMDKNSLKDLFAIPE